MTVQFSATVRNARLDAIETAIGTSPILRLYNGTPPANVAASLSGNTLLAEGTLPSDWAAGASSGSKSKSGTWTLTGQSGAGAGTSATFYRIYASDGTTPHEQGTVGATSSGADLELDNVSVANGQTVSITTFTKSEAA